MLIKQSNQSGIFISIYIYLYIIFNSVFDFYKTVFPSPTEGNLLAQPAMPVNEDRTDLLRIPPFWAKTSVNPPFIWETWVGQFFLAVSLKGNISPGEVLVAPVELVDEP